MRLVRIATVILVGRIVACSPEYGESSPAGQDGGFVDGGSDSASGAAGCARTDTDPTLLAWYPFDENGGTSVTDCSTHGLHGTSIGSKLKWAAGHSSSSGFALDLDGASCIGLGAASLLAFETASRFTVAAWVKPRTYADEKNDARELISRRSKSPYTGWHFGSDDPEDFELDLESDQDPDAETQSRGPTAVWFHVAGVYDGALKMYINGVLTSTTPGPHPVTADPNATARIGCNLAGEGYDGLVDDLRVYGRALGDAEIASLAKP